jgi:hypothetical protein
MSEEANGIVNGQEHMSISLQQMPKVLELYLEITQYPILAQKIRERMRQEVFSRGVISPLLFEQEAREKAVLSQKREGLVDPLVEEPPEIWAERVKQIRDHLTDFYFAYNLPHELFRSIVQSLVGERAPSQEFVISFNPELAPWDILFAQADQYKEAPPEKQNAIRPHLQEIIVVLIKSMISDQLRFVGIAKELFSVDDLKEIRRRRIGRGKIGGKAAGMMLAWKALQRSDGDLLDVSDKIVIPDSYFIGSDVFYDYHSLNRLFDFINQKYKSKEEIEAEYPKVRELYAQGRFPPDIYESLSQLLLRIGKTPLIVRSSSLLEDNYETSFAGKYESFFCPNQGTQEENLASLLHAITQVYASVVSPDALFYRRRMGLIDYDERMAILIQKVQGALYGPYFFPTLAGVGFSRNPFRWNPRIRREDGFLRLVWGLGTRAVDRLDNDYPRMLALSHPQLRPESGAKEIRKYSQHLVDVIDLRDNSFKTLPIASLLGEDYPALHYLVSMDSGDYVQPVFSLGSRFDPKQAVLTFDNLLRNSDFVPLMKAILKRLERAYGKPVDIEFTVDILPGYPKPDFMVHLLQCRPQSNREEERNLQLPTDIPRERTLFTANKLVPQGRVSGIRYIVYVDPDCYSSARDYATKLEMARLVGRLNRRLEGERFILMGPGRWGSANVDLGVKVTYADIYNTRMLIEMTSGKDGAFPEASYGTHFFQDLVEAEIHPLILYPEDRTVFFNRDFFANAANVLGDLLPADQGYADLIKVIDVSASSGGKLLEVIMNGEQEMALGYLTSTPSGKA